jgi:DNA-binding LacI/PurR family transcriptional regulator
MPVLEKGKILPSYKERQLIKPYILESLKTSNLFFVFCDMWALEICSILKEANVRIPQDVALAGFDGKHEALSYQPQLTTVGQDYQSIAKTVMDIVINKVFNGTLSESQEIRIEPKLLTGVSS